MLLCSSECSGKKAVDSGVLEIEASSMVSFHRRPVFLPQLSHALPGSKDEGNPLTFLIKTRGHTQLREVHVSSVQSHQCHGWLLNFVGLV